MTKKEQREAKLKTALKELGSGKNKIAEALKTKKIKGVMGSPDYCVIAVFVKKLFPKAASFDVDSDNITICWNNDDCISIVPPKAIGNFITSFDGNAYPHLVKN